MTTPSSTQRRPSPRLQTADMTSQQQPRYSFMPTPLDMHANIHHQPQIQMRQQRTEQLSRPQARPPPQQQQHLVYEQHSPTDSHIDESPISPHLPPQYTAAAGDRRAQLTDMKALEATLCTPPVQSHPAFAVRPGQGNEGNAKPSRNTVPSASSSATETAHATTNPRHPAAPLPVKVLTNSNDTVKSTPSVPKPTPTADIIYNPHSLHGPNIVPSDHRPGQVSHPNATVSPHWKHSLCEPDLLCCLGLFCPCHLYGKANYRFHRKATHQDPTDTLGYEPCNSSCVIYSFACGFQSILAAIHRTRIRKLYHIEGSFGTDCLNALCCCCCVVAQNERELRDREELIRRQAGPVAGYTAPVMQYAPPPR